MPLYLIHYGSEVGLKGKNRGDFIRRLQHNIKRQLGVRWVEHLMGRLLVEDERPDLDFSRVFGVAWWAEAVAVAPEMAAITAEAVRQAQSHPLAGQQPTFAVRATRADKSFPHTSVEIEREVGTAVAAATGWQVDLKHPQVTLHIEVAPGRVFVFSRRHKGHHGLPVGTSGKVVGLFSGGIDSVIAAWLLARRGATVELVHFHAFAAARYAHAEKVGRLAELLAAYIPDLKVHYVPYHLFQVATAGLARRNQRYELVVFRRYMARVAERLAQRLGAYALFTGDSLGQVASQTVENLTLVDRAVNLPIFRPLIGWNKQEIIDLGERLRFYAVAKQPYKDCCSIISTHPATRARLEVVERMEADLGIESLVQAALADVETLTYEGRASVEALS